MFCSDRSSAGAREWSSFTNKASDVSGHQGTRPASHGVRGAKSLLCSFTPSSEGPSHSTPVFLCWLSFPLGMMFKKMFTCLDIDIDISEEYILEIYPRKYS